MIEQTEATLRANLSAALAVPRWVEAVAAQAPYESSEQLLLVAYTEATPLSADEIAQAIAHHPRIGEKPVGEGTAQTFSRNEQASLSDDDPAVVEAIAAGNRAYENRFGRVFIIRAKGRTRREILAELHRRLELDDATELAIVGEQLRDIALLRLRALYPDDANPEVR